ncbi:MAG: bifunctional (p)ppGpp synthetase/guanosine-3',5'-bis(diphosphate) 3'-pyrophosphohydrolase [Faecalibacterium sp.]|nr:bifunctional (p)ppGpp synthetase/guanosine-3',5'-bis(diphosphate) 3'-pyrophosphohydrolase [Faecalibacterium sp.]
MHDGQFRKSGEPYIIHPCAVAEILIDLGFDEATIMAALLHDVIEDTPATDDDIKKNFGDEVLYLVEGVTKLDKLKFENVEEEQAENLRKMFFAMAKDYRVIIIKLADRLHNMRSLSALPPHRQQSIASETLEIYAKMAGRLGLSLIKSELEDLCMRYLYPDDYYELAHMVKSKLAERQEYVSLVCEIIRKQLDELGIKGEVFGRPKHLYSIWRKMKTQGKTFDQIYDLTAVRVIVPTVKDCYTVLGTIHTLWKPIPGRFKDYIAMPKPNNYQSLHTTVITNYKEPAEIQIRTYEMHKVAEYGIAAHWKYKEKGKNTNKFDPSLNWMQDIVDADADAKDNKEFLNSVKTNILDDEIFVFTPKGKVVSLPVGSTPIDFAYAVHSEVGNKCTGAKVNMKMVPLTTALKNGDIVEIITSNASHGPSRDWLKIVKSAGARNKIRQFLKREMKEENIKRGKDMLEHEAKRRGYNLSELMSDQWLSYVMNRYSISSLDDLYASVGYGGLNTNQILIKLIDFFKKDLLTKNPVVDIKGETPSPVRRRNNDGVIIKGYDDFVVRLSHCCNPVPGDKIIGYISRGRGVSVHCVDCPNVKNMEKERLIEAKWDDVIGNKFVATINILADNKGGILAEITNTIAQMKIQITAAFAKLDKEMGAIINVSMEISSTTQLEEVFNKLMKIKGVHDVHR